MSLTSKRLSLAFAFVLFVFTVNAQSKKSINIWLTDPAKSVFFQEQPARFFDTKKDAGSIFTIRVNDTPRYQTIDGFGFSFTGGSAQNIIKLPAKKRTALLKELFATNNKNIGISYLRVSIGASDLNDHVFSYDDLPNGEKDPELTHFDLGPDKKDVIPVLQEILKINPKLKIMGSPWSPPVWMKDNNNVRGGKLLPQYYAVYAKYFVKYILAMRKYGIRIDAVTVQNEPLHPGNTPSLYMTAPEQTEFVKNYLGPAFRKAHIDTKIIVYDHNADRPDYPISILNDTAARKYIDGSAFHLYAGTIDALSLVHDAHPDKQLYFTEQWIGAPGDFAGDIPWHIENLIIGGTRNWCKTVLEWNLASDPQYRPHTDNGGCVNCLGAVTIGDSTITRNPAYYIVAHASKFARPGSVRVASNTSSELPNTAFRTPDGRTVLIVLNTTKTKKAFNILYKGKLSKIELNGRAVGTYIW